MIVRMALLVACIAAARVTLGSDRPPPGPGPRVLTWTSGEYRYDGNGNVASIGTPSAPGTQGYRTYGYDATSRLTRAHIGVASSVIYGYEYDPYGNRTAYSLDQQRVTVPVSSATNRLDDAAYDANGSQTVRGSTSATYDGFGMPTSYRFDSANAESFVYTASDERIGVLRGNDWTWSFRDAGGRVLRQYRSLATDPSASWEWLEDFVHRGPLLLGAERAPAEGGRQHYHLDHLGSPRLVTGAWGSVVSEHDFLPFGEERTAVNQQQAKGFRREQPHRFTGHERDFDRATPDDTSASLDSMHARYYTATTGRFSSVDPYLDIDRTMRNPQKWNRYAYVRNNPLRFTDPTGMDEDIGPETATIVNHSQQTVWIAFDADRLGPGGTNLDVRIPLKPGESSSRFTTDADAVIVGPGQKINGETGGAFKVRLGAVTIQGGRTGELQLRTSVVQKVDPGQGHDSNPPQQWVLRKEDVKNQQQTRQETERTKPQRERRIREREKRKPWWRIF